jgi:hypothetical protein
MATKQMLETGDFIDIRNQDLPRYKQPAGIYWLQVLAVTIAGNGTDSPIGVYRLTSLVGAIAASRQARSYDSVILKTLGATRGQILAAQGLEYALLAGALCLLALALGIGAAWYVIVEVFEFRWTPDWPLVLATLGGGAALTLGIGLIGSLPLLNVRAAEALRRL